MTPRDDTLASHAAPPPSPAPGVLGAFRQGRDDAAYVALDTGGDAMLLRDFADSVGAIVGPSFRESGERPGPDAAQLRESR